VYTEKALKNTIYSLATLIVNALATFAVRTVFIRYLGAEILGVNATVIDTVNLLTMSEMGIQTAIIYKMYKPIVDGDLERQKILFNLYRNAYRIVAIVILVIGVFLTPFIPTIVKTTLNIGIVYEVYYIQLFLIFLTFLVSYYKIVLLAHQRQFVYTRFEIIVNIICSGIRCIVLAGLRNYLLYLFVSYIALFLNTAFVIINTKRDYEEVLKKTTVPKSDVHSMLSDLKKMIIMNASGYVYGSTDSVLISYFFGSLWVGLVSNYKLVTSLIKNLVVSNISNSVSASWGTFLNSSPNSFEVWKNYKYYTFIEFLLGAIFLIPTWLLVDDFIVLWLGDSYRINSIIIALIIADIFLTSLSEPNAVIIRNLGLFTQENVASLSAMIVNIVSSILFANLIGISGIFLGTVLAVIIYSVIRSLCINKNCFESQKEYLIDYGKDNLFYIVFFFSVYFGLNILFKKVLYVSSIINFILKGLLSEGVIIILLSLIWYRTENFKRVIKMISKMRSKRSQP